MKVSVHVDFDPIELTASLITVAKGQAKAGSGSATVVIKDSEGKVVEKPTACVTFNSTAIKEG